jgi:hypothetical protein
VFIFVEIQADFACEDENAALARAAGLAVNERRRFAQRGEGSSGRNGAE